MRSGEEREINARSGTSLMQNLKDGGVTDILALCGGNCVCATCHVYIVSASEALLRPSSVDEEDMLSESDVRKENSRLSCQIVVDDSMAGVRLEVAPGS
jgi:2Fe-2S ferredoxin